MSDISKLGYEPIPLGSGPARNAPDLSSLGLLPPLPKPTQPVEPRPSMPKPELPSVKSEVVIDNKKEAPKPPLPGRLAWVPEAAKALLKPTKQKGIIAAGIASLIGGAMVANALWPATPVKPTLEIAKEEPAAKPDPPRAGVVMPEPVKLPPPVVIDEAPFKLPPLNVPPPSTAPPSGTVQPAGGMQIPEVTLPTAPPLPSIQLPRTEAAADTNTAMLPPVKLPELPPLQIPPTKPATEAPPLTPPAVTLPPVTVPATTPPVTAPPMPSVTAPPLPGIEMKPPTVEVKPAVTAPPVTIPDTSREPVFVPTNAVKPPVTAPVTPPVTNVPGSPASVPGSPGIVPNSPPDLPAVKPAGGMAPREDYDVDVHYATATDTWANISRQHLGDERYAEALKAYNGGQMLTANQPVDVPPIHVLRKQYANLIAAPRPADPPKDLPRNVGSQRTYEIPFGGMTMKELAKKSLGDENFWGQIWELNPKLRADEPVPAGTKVKLPTDSRIGD